MGKKFDINKPRAYSNMKKSNHNFNHNNINNYSQNESNENINQNASEISNLGYQREYELPKNVNLTIKMPIAAKIAISATVIAIPLILFMVFVVIFGSDDLSDGYLALSGICPTVEVVNTDCNENAENCSNRYDGKVEFEDYIAGVVAAEIGAAPNNLEYYKVAAIAARTYFYSHINESCKVQGNATYQAYMDVEDSSAKEIIQQAVEETTGKVIVKDEELSEAYYSSACVVHADNKYYYVRYGSKTLNEKKLQYIPKEWDREESAYSRYLSHWYNLVDKNDNDYFNKSCPNNHDYGMSQIGALYLVTKENYSYEQVLKYYYGNDIEIKNINIATSQIVNGFITPVNGATCTDTFGCRLHPIKKIYVSHDGLDLAASSGTPIYAPKDGKIISVEKNIPGKSTTNACGNSVHIDHGDGIKTRYCHILYNSIPDNIKVGASVTQGEVIGAVGATGNVTGPHLHYEVYVNGSLVNPADYIDLSNVTNGSQCRVANVSDSYCRG